MNFTQTVLVSAAFTVVTVSSDLAYGCESIMASKAHSKTISVSKVDSTTISEKAVAGLVLPEKSEPWFVPKTERGRRIMELRRLAEEAGEEFFSSAELMAAMHKNRV